MNKPTIPNDVADAIEELREKPGALDNARIIELAMPSRTSIAIDKTVDAIRSIPFDTLMAALVNGYERELTEEQIAHAKIRNRHKAELITARFSGHYGARQENVAFADGIKFTLDALGIKVSGVNAV